VEAAVENRSLNSTQKMESAGSFETFVYMIEISSDVKMEAVSPFEALPAYETTQALRSRRLSFGYLFLDTNFVFFVQKYFNCATFLNDLQTILFL
jgi:hypothetical protein